MIEGISLFIILLVVAYFVLVPLIVNKPEKNSRLLDQLVEDDDEDTLSKNKEALFTTINEIEFDYSMNKLSEDDYNQLKNQYRQQALKLLHEEDELELETTAQSPGPVSPNKTDKADKTDIEKEIERELAALRKQVVVESE